MEEYILEFSGMTAVTILFLLASAILIRTNRTVDRQARMVFFLNVVLLFFICVADWINYCLGRYNPDLRMFQLISTSLTFAVAPFLPSAIAHTIFPTHHARVVFGVLSVHALVELANIFWPLIFYIDAQNIYHRGPFYLLYMISYSISAVYLVVESIMAGRTYQLVSPWGLLAVLACLAGGVAIQVAIPFVRTTWPAVAMAVMLYFLFYSEMVLRNDPLTNLLNRHAYDEFISSPQLPCTVAIIDVDDFKSVNDTYGHAFGDEVLATIAGLIRRAYGTKGLVYRTGGDEFTVVVKGDGKNDATYEQKLYELIAAAQQDESRLPGVSVGAAHADVDCHDIFALVERADEAMYESKRARKVGR